MKRETAEYINSLMLDVTSRLSDSVGAVKEQCTKDEIAAYLKPVSQMMALAFDVLDMVYKVFPDLEPKSLDQ